MCVRVCVLTIFISTITVTEAKAQQYHDTSLGHGAGLGGAAGLSSLGGHGGHNDLGGHGGHSVHSGLGGHGLGHGVPTGGLSGGHGRPSGGLGGGYSGLGDHENLGSHGQDCRVEYEEE